MKIEHTEVYGFGAALRAMRNPRNSWPKSDSPVYKDLYSCKNPYSPWIVNSNFIIFAPEFVLDAVIGTEDLKLAVGLVNTFEPHCNFLGYIIVTADLTLPRYVRTDLDTYKVGTVRLSCSTRFAPKIRPFEPSDFEGEDVLKKELNLLNRLRKTWVEAQDHTSRRLAFEKMKRHLPEGYLQKATMLFSYSVLLKIYRERYNHPLSEFRSDNPASICSWIRCLPYMQDFINASL